MQLISMAMPRGDKNEQKNKNHKQTRSNDESADNSSTIYLQNQDAGDVYNASSDSSSLGCLFPLSVDTTLQNIPRCRVNIAEITSLSAITSSLYVPVLQVSSSDSLTSVSIAHSNNEDSVILQQQDNVHGNSNDTCENTSVRELFRPRTGSSSSSLVDNDAQSVNLFGVKNTDLIVYHQDVADIIPPPVKSEPASSEADTLEVDDNMNVTKDRHETLTNLQPRPLVHWFKLLPHADVLTNTETPRRRRKVSDNGGVSENCQILNAVEQFFNIRHTHICRQRDAENCSQHYCDSSQKVPSEDRRSYETLPFNNTSQNAGLLEFHRAEEVPTSWHGSDYSLITKMEPPVWTSLALRENTIHIPESSCVPHHCSSRLFAGGDFNFQRCALSSAYNNNSVVRAPETEMEARAGLFRLNEINSLDNYVFQNCEVENEDNVTNQNVDGFDEVNSDEEVESFAEIKNNVPITLNDIDCITRMFPSSHIVRDLVLNQITDEEVSILMSHHTSDDDELETSDIVEAYADDGRPTNPVACILDNGGNEHFLPILHNVIHDASDVDGK